MSKKRTLSSFDVDLIALIDAAKAINPLMGQETRHRILTYIVKRSLGDHYEITRKGS